MCIKYIITAGITDWIRGINDYVANGLPTKTLTFKTGWDMTTFQTSLLNKLQGLY